MSFLTRGGVNRHRELPLDWVNEKRVENEQIRWKKSLQRRFLAASLERCALKPRYAGHRMESGFPGDFPLSRL